MKHYTSIPSCYIPVSTPSTAKRVFFALSTNDFSIQALANDLARKRGTIDNIARDLVMMGVATHDRKKGVIKLTHESTELSLAAMFRFFNSHLVIRKIIEKFGSGFSNVDYQSFEEIVRTVYSIGDFQEKTIRVRTLNIMAWLEALGIVLTETGGAIQHQASAGVPAAFHQLKAFRETTNTKAFRGIAPPARVLEVLNRLKQPGYKYQSKDRNPINELRSLRIISSGVEPVFLEKPTNIDTRIWLANKVLRQHSVRQVQTVIRNSPSASDLEIGQALDIFVGLSDATKKRYGCSLKNWANWIEEVTTPVKR